MAFACAAAPAAATVPGTPRVPQDPTQVFHEDFEHGSLLTPVLLTNYVGRPTGALSINAKYTAAQAWLEDCNGAIVAFDSNDDDWEKALCPEPTAATGAWAYVRMMAWALGSVQGEGSAAAEANHAVTAWTYSKDPGAGLVQLRTLPQTPITFPQRHDRFITFSIDAAELCAPPAQPGVHNLAQFEFYLVSVRASQGRCRAGAGVVCRLGALAKGAAAQIMVTVIVNRHDHGTVRNTATVDSDGTDLDPDDNVAHAKVTVGAPRPEDVADLVVAKHADHARRLTRGEQVAYLITVRDQGTDDATGVRLIDTPSFAGWVISVDPSQGSCKVEGSWLTCELGRIEAGAEATVRVVVEPTRPGDARNTVGVSAEQLDPKPADDLAGVTVRIGRRPALGVGCHKAGVRLALPTTRVAAPGGIRAITIKVGDRLIHRLRFTAPLPTAKVIRGVRFGTAGLSPGLHKITILVKGADGDVTRRVLRFTICPRPRFTG